MQFEMFMNPAERERAKTYYKQMQQEKEDSMCKFCNKEINAHDERNDNKTILQSTECWHQVHVECFREHYIHCKSENK